MKPFKDFEGEQLDLKINVKSFRGHFRVKLCLFVLVIRLTAVFLDLMETANGALTDNCL